MRSLAIACLLVVATPLSAQNRWTVINMGDWYGNQNLFEVARTTEELRTMVLKLNKTSLPPVTEKTFDQWIEGRKDLVALSEIEDDAFAVFGLALNAETYRGSAPEFQASEMEDGVIHLRFSQRTVTQPDRTTQQTKTGRYWIFATTPEFLKELGLDSIQKGQKFVYEPINDPKKQIFPFVPPTTN